MENITKLNNKKRKKKGKNINKDFEGCIGSCPYYFVDVSVVTCAARCTEFKSQCNTHAQSRTFKGSASV